MVCKTIVVMALWVRIPITSLGTYPRLDGFPKSLKAKPSQHNQLCSRTTGVNS